MHSGLYQWMAFCCCCLTQFHCVLGASIFLQMTSSQPKKFTRGCQSYLLTPQCFLECPLAPVRRVELMGWFQGISGLDGSRHGVCGAAPASALLVPATKEATFPSPVGHTQPVAIPDLSAFCPKRFLSWESRWGLEKNVSKSRSIDYKALPSLWGLRQ